MRARAHVYTRCARALCYYILSVVPDAGAGGVPFLPLVTSGFIFRRGIFLDAPPACARARARVRWCVSFFSREKKEGLREKGVVGDARVRYESIRAPRKKLEPAFHRERHYH